MQMPIDGQHAAMIRIKDYESIPDVFIVGAVAGISEEDRRNFPIYSPIAAEFDDFIIPALLLPALIGEYGEPSELVGRIFVVKLP